MVSQAHERTASVTVASSAPTPSAAGLADGIAAAAVAACSAVAFVPGVSSNRMDHAPFIWTAYLLTGAVLSWTALAPILRRRRVMQQLDLIDRAGRSDDSNP